LHLAAVHRAIQIGANVKGYFWWTLVDNFEWAEGYAPHFGLFANDLKTQTRTPRTAAEIYARIARENGVAGELLDRFNN
jgi:beta-glucosidase